MNGPEVEGVRTAELPEENLSAWGWDVGRVALAHGVFVCLYGELGAGKSTLARAACRGAGVRGSVPSPTFTLINRYTGHEGRLVYHADLYRLSGPEGLADMGWQDLVQTDGAVLLEWPERAGDRLPTVRWEIRLEFVADPTRRRVTSRSMGGVVSVPRFADETEA